MLRCYAITYEKQIEYICAPTEHKAILAFCNYKGWSIKDWGSYRNKKIKELTEKQTIETIIDENHNYDDMQKEQSLFNKMLLVKDTDTEFLGFKLI